MLFNYRTKVDVCNNVAVTEHNIFCVACFYVFADSVKGFHSAAVNAAFTRIGRKDRKSAVFSGHIPFLTVTYMVHKALVVFAGNKTNVIDSGVGHVGKCKVDHAVSSAERNGTEGSVGGKLGNKVIMHVTYDYTEDISHFTASFPKIAPGSISASSATIASGPIRVTFPSGQPIFAFSPITAFSPIMVL